MLLFVNDKFQKEERDS